MKIQRFEDIRAWQAARELTKLIYKVVEEGRFARDFRLRDQIRDASGSIMHNIAEGFDSASDDEFIRFLIYSRRSASEVQSQLYVATDQRYITPEEFDSLYAQAEGVKKQINAFITYLLESNNRKTLRERAKHRSNRPTAEPIDEPTTRPSD